MKVTIITVVLNGAKTIRETIESVLSQTYENIEYIVIDGQSSDGTLDIVNEYKEKINKIISEPDQGLYAAINKGIDLATGDIIGLIHSDDYYLDNLVIQRVVDEFISKNVDSVFADLLYIKDDNINRVLRYYSAKNFIPEKLIYGLMPPHPTFFVKKELYSKYGGYEIDYKIASDYEMFVRLLYINRISYSYINLPIIKMRVGGVSSGGLKTKILCNKEVLRAIRSNGIKTNHLIILKKYPIKVWEIIKGYAYNVLVKKNKTK
ncbi:glycosyl transferase [Halarcobacter ebronensis]|uniref:Glycosyl transferase n=1 Tax=Halarcobacter ebronensis TaxID=1462615 RepID=A0A4Q0YAR3_9BACT|nr:glycosyltransferase family 2 protein [Halarcobacter ebronensis]RXJ67396.1 glycosyl transferase [Halarcobacter ebronensis]